MTTTGSINFSPLREVRNTPALSTRCIRCAIKASVSGLTKKKVRYLYSFVCFFRTFRSRRSASCRSVSSGPRTLGKRRRRRRRMTNAPVVASASEPAPEGCQAERSKFWHPARALPSTRRVPRSIQSAPRRISVTRDQKKADKPGSMCVCRERDGEAKSGQIGISSETKGGGIDQGRKEGTRGRDRSGGSNEPSAIQSLARSVTIMMSLAPRVTYRP